jgi:hypothetical protein
VSLDEILRRFQSAIDQLLERDEYLLRHDASERSITHKLGFYLQALFPEWEVDCEYNRNGHGPKTVGLPRRDDPEVLESTSTFPDVIVHQRGSNARNLLVVEAKKQGCALAAQEFDRLKVEAYARDLAYTTGILLTFGTGRGARNRVRYKVYYKERWIDPPATPST